MEENPDVNFSPLEKVTLSLRLILQVNLSTFSQLIASHGINSPYLLNLVSPSKVADHVKRWGGPVFLYGFPRDGGIATVPILKVFISAIALAANPLIITHARKNNVTILHDIINFKYLNRSE